MLYLRTTIMHTSAALLLFLCVSMASAFALPSQGRHRRGATGASNGATAGSFATSGSYGSGYGGAGGFAFPGPAAYGPNAFDSAFRSYFDQMESLLAAQQLHAQALSNSFNAAAAAANAIPGNAVDAGQGSAAFGGPGQAGSASQYAGAFSGGPGGGAGFGFGHGGAGGAGGADAASGHAPASFSDLGGGAGGAGGSHVGSGLGGAAHGAQASLAVNNRGGFGQAQLFPDPGLSSRIAGDIAPLSGSGNFGVFSSSSSSSHSDGSGKTHTFKQATVGVNDNGKITTFSVKDP